jgi:hypothetical protein
MDLPSGDQAGSRLAVCGASLTLRMSPCSAGTVMIWPCASKTARTPVGEMFAFSMWSPTFAQCGRSCGRSAAIVTWTGVVARVAGSYT